MLRKVFEHRVNKNYIGRHVTADYWGCKYEDNSVYLTEVLTAAAKAAGATILGSVSHDFEPNGTTCILLLAESHISIHTWPEYDYVAIDLFTCGKDMRPEKALEYFEKAFKPKKKQIKAINRGKNR